MDHTIKFLCDLMTSTQSTFTRAGGAGERQVADAVGIVQYTVLVERAASDSITAICITNSGVHFFYYFPE
jgi:hypothetical protein